MQFSVGDKVRVIPAMKGFSPLLAEALGKVLTIKEVKSGVQSYVVIEEIYARHGAHTFYPYRFELVQEASPHSQVIAKIKQMDNRRKELGYAL